jgi:uncharacterized protein YndB with AHSA1/START domain
VTKRIPHDEVSTEIAASPDTVYAMVSDVTRMGEWSPETIRCTWLDGATGPAAGARFKGTNKRGVFRWSTKPEVVVADRGREFSFVTHSIGPSTRWTYRFEAAPGGGTDLIESFESLDPPSTVITFVERRFMHITDRTADLEAGMLRTLERIKAVAESRSGR